MPSPSTSRANGKKSKGPPKGRRLTTATRERLRGAIDVKRVIGHLDAMMSGQMIVDPHQVSAAKILLDRVMPTLAATDLTSGGESLVIERATFKPRGQDK
jgi:hypothetical protein